MLSDLKNTERVISLSENAVFLAGVLRGAIYDFGSGKVFWVSKEAQDAIIKFSGRTDLPIEIADYFNLLSRNGLYSKSIAGSTYSPERPELEILTTVWLELTLGCNERCLHCYTGQNHPVSVKPLSSRNWQNVISQINQIGAQKIILIGGEPCIHPEIDKIILAASQTGIRTTLFTNGTLLSNELIEIIVKSSVEVKFSIYGHNSKIHDSITRMAGSFDLLNSNIEKLLASGVKVTPAIVVMKENQDYLAEIRAYIESIGLFYNGYDVIREVFAGNQSDHVPTNQNILSRAFRTKPNFSITKAQFDSRMFYNGCWWGKIAILANGDVTPCVFERLRICGNILDSAIKDIISSKEMKACWEHDYSKVDDCKVCEFRMACKDCRPVATCSTNNPRSKSPRCLYRPDKGIWNEL